MSRLRELYDNEITKKMTEKFGYKNPMMVPKIDKIVINMGVGEAKENSKLLDIAVKEMETIAGQKAVLTRAKNSIANFKLREGQAIGCKVTLRGEKMYEFLDRLVNLALPRVRDFRGAVSYTHLDVYKRQGTTSKTKKAIVQLTADSKEIEIFEGL